MGAKQEQWDTAVVEDSSSGRGDAAVGNGPREVSVCMRHLSKPAGLCPIAASLLTQSDRQDVSLAVVYTT